MDISCCYLCPFLLCITLIYTKLAIIFDISSRVPWANFALFYVSYNMAYPVQTSIHLLQGALGYGALDSFSCFPFVDDATLKILHLGTQNSRLAAPSPQLQIT